jgi:large subunit ribosomal protein L5
MFKLSEKYKKQIVPEMMERFGYRNKMAVPKIKKIIVNCGFGKQVADKASKEGEKIQKHILQELSLITGQKPALRKAKKSISGFKLREGTVIGAVVTLRGRRMYDFLERLIFITLPRTRDFQGIDSKLFDQKGNLSLGFKEHTSFPEISVEKEKSIFGLEVTIVTTSKSREEGIELLRLIGFPIK